MLGIVFIFVGFLVFGVLGQQYYNLSIQEREFGDCHEFESENQVQIDCDTAANTKAAFFALVFVLIGVGVFFLVKGIRGKWDQDVKPEDIVGPGSSFPS